MNRLRLVKVLIVAMAILIPALWITGAQSQDAEDVHFFLNMVEIKGSTSTDTLTAPEIDPTTLSQGYRYKAPGVLDANAPNKWEVSSYMFSDASMVIRKGDKVKVTLFGVNGDEHLVYVQSPTGEMLVETQQMNRGREYVIEFEAEEAGYYKLVCANHAPTMTSNILAVPDA